MWNSPAAARELRLCSYEILVVIAAYLAKEFLFKSLLLSGGNAISLLVAMWSYLAI
jgi:hypothetical protein